MIPIANAKTSNSPPGIGLTSLLLFNQFHRVSKKRGIMNSAISDLLFSGSNVTEKPAINAEIAGFHPVFNFHITDTHNMYFQNIFMYHQYVFASFLSYTACTLK